MSIERQKLWKVLRLNSFKVRSPNMRLSRKKFIAPSDNSFTMPRELAEGSSLDGSEFYSLKESHLAHAAKDTIKKAQKRSFSTIQGGSRQMLDPELGGTNVREEQQKQNGLRAEWIICE